MTSSGVDVLASDGGVIHLRAIAATDREQLVDFYQQLPPHDVYTRFFSHRLPAEEFLTRPADQRSTDFTVGAFAADALIGVGGYIWEEVHGSAEVAFAIATEHQHRGIGTLLLENLAATARDNDIGRFHAHTLPLNRHMIEMFLRAGYVVDTQSDGDTVFVSFVLDDAADDAIDARDQRASAHSMQRILHPKAVAIIGPTTEPMTAGHALVRSLLRGGFRGQLFRIGATEHRVDPDDTEKNDTEKNDTEKNETDGVLVDYPTVASVPTAIDLALITAPTAEVRPAVEACGRAGVHAAVVLTAGFAEVDEAGTAAQQDVLDTARHYGMRLVGPNCLGIANTNPAVQLDATVSPAPLMRHGDVSREAVSIASQSGALGISLIHALTRANVSIASFVSLGNKADVSGNDLLQYWQSDPDTDIGVLYLESFGNPRRFARIAARFSETKPLIVATGGDSARGDNAGRSLLIPFLERSGVVAVRTLAELVDVTRLLAAQPIPAGDRIAIVTNSRGFATIARDACDSTGLQAPTLGSATLDRLAQLPPTPVDVDASHYGIVATASVDQFAAALSVVLDDPDVDGAIAVHADLLRHDATDITHAIDRAADDHPHKPVAATVLSGSNTEGLAHPQSSSVPIFDFPEEAATALGHAARLARWRTADHRTASSPNGFDLQQLRSAATEALVSAARTSHDGVERLELRAQQTDALLAAAGITRVDEPTAEDLDVVVLRASVDDLFGVVLSVGRQHGTDDVELCGEALAPLDPGASTELIAMLRLPTSHRDAISTLANRIGQAVHDIPAIVEIALVTPSDATATPGVIDASFVLDARPPPRGGHPRRLGRVGLR